MFNLVDNDNLFTLVVFKGNVDSAINVADVCYFSFSGVGMK